MDEKKGVHGGPGGKGAAGYTDGWGRSFFYDNATSTAALSLLTYCNNTCVLTHALPCGH